MRGTLFINTCLIKIHLDPLKAAWGRGRGSFWHQCAAIDCASHYQYMTPSRTGGEERVFLLPPHSSISAQGRFWAESKRGRRLFLALLIKRKGGKGAKMKGETTVARPPRVRSACNQY